MTIRPEGENNVSITLEYPVMLDRVSNVSFGLQVNGRLVGWYPLGSRQEPLLLYSLLVGLAGHMAGREHLFTTTVPVAIVESIAMYVAGDGTDEQRLALADGIRTRWAHEVKVTP